MVNIEVALRVALVADEGFGVHGGLQGLDVGAGVTGRYVGGVVGHQQRGKAGQFGHGGGVALHGEAARREAAAVRLDGGEVGFLILGGQAGVFVAAPGAIFFVHEEHGAHRALGLEAGGAQQAQRFHALHAAGTVVVGALGQVPGIEVATHGDDFLWEFAAFDFAHHVVAFFVGQGDAFHFQLELQVGVGLEELAEPVGSIGAEGRAGHLGHALGVAHGPGVRVIVAGAGHGAHQGPYRPALGGFDGPVGALVHGPAVGRPLLNESIIEGPVVKDELAFYDRLGQVFYFFQAVHFYYAGLQFAAGAHRAAQGAHRHPHAFILITHNFAALLAAAHPVRHHHLLQIHAVETRFFHGGFAPLHGQLGLRRARQARPDGAGEVAQVVVALAAQQGFIKYFAQGQRVGRVGFGGRNGCGRALALFTRLGPAGSIEYQ